MLGISQSSKTRSGDSEYILFNPAKPSSAVTTSNFATERMSPTISRRAFSSSIIRIFLPSSSRSVFMLLRRFPERNRKPERCAFTEDAFNCDIAAMQAYDLGYNGKPQAGATWFLVRAICYLVKLFKYFSQFIFRYADAGIGNTDFNEMAADFLRTYGNTCA